jgi:hypothetical protein
MSLKEYRLFPFLDKGAYTYYVIIKGEERGNQNLMLHLIKSYNL